MRAGLLAGEILEEVAREQPAIACVSAVPSFGYMHTRYLCRRLRAQFQGLKLIAAILTEGDVAEIKQRRPPLAADELASSLKQCVAQISSLVHVDASRARRPVLTPS